MEMLFYLVYLAMLAVGALFLLGLAVTGVVMARKFTYGSGDSFPAIVASILQLGLGTLLIKAGVAEHADPLDAEFQPVFRVGGAFVVTLGATTATIIAARYGTGRLGAILRWPVVHAGVFVIALGLTWLAIKLWRVTAP